MSRWLPVCLAVVVLALFVAQPAMAAATHEGKVVTAANGKLTMTDKDGKQMSHAVAPTARITLDGKACKLEDLKAGFTVKVTVDKAIDGKEQAVQIAALSRPAEPPK
jgi:hypothetical protein